MNKTVQNSEVGMIVSTQERWGLPEEDFIEVMTNAAVNDEQWWENNPDMFPSFNDFLVDRFNPCPYHIMYEDRQTILREFFTWLVEQLKEDAVYCEEYIYITADIS